MYKSVTSKGYIPNRLRIKSDETNLWLKISIWVLTDKSENDTENVVRVKKYEGQDWYLRRQINKK